MVFAQPLLKVGIDHLWIGVLRAVPDPCTSSTAVLEPPGSMQQRALQTPVASHSSRILHYIGRHKHERPPADWQTCATRSV